MKTTFQNNRCLVAGIGSPHGDDQAGWLVLDRLSQNENFHFDVRKLSAPIELLDIIEGRECLVCLDAIEGSEPPGTIKRYLWPFDATWMKCNRSTHGMDLVSVLKIAESVGLLPEKVILWTINGIDWTPGAKVNSSVKNNLHQLEDHVTQELSDMPASQTRK